MIALFAVTDAGRRAADEVAVAVDGQVCPLDELPRLWSGLDGAVFFLAAGATVRLIAPLLADKRTDPGVVCVDEARRYAIALAGGHGGGANQLATRVAAAIGAEPVITTASDATGTTGLDELVAVLDAHVDGDLAAAGTALLDGAALVENPLGFPLPPLPPVSGPARHTIVVTDRAGTADPSTTRLVPPTLVVGIGSARGVSADAVRATLRRLETEHGLDPRAVRAYASVDLKADEAGILAAVAPSRLLTYPAAVLGAVDVPNPSDVVMAEVGTPSVAEAAALHAARELAGGAPVELAAEKTKDAMVTVASARIRPRGRLAIVGLGPGAADLRVPRADAELRRASVVVGLDQYLDQVAHLLRPGTEVHSSGLGDEERRAADAVALAAKGHAVALIGSGDAGVYAMASPALQQAGSDIEVVGVPGVTAALAAAALLGAPLGHDHMLISLSDLHTPWDVIERRIAAAASADVVACFYNPRSRDRHWQLGAALDTLRAHRPPSTPVGAVRQAGRPGQRVWTAPISDFDPTEVDMLTTVIVGSSSTRLTAGRMVTPRGYRWSVDNDVLAD
ncbi:precorrin-3B C(17)-methyltransferase [Pseudonocardia sp. TRM90224]|uniref:precorrin-3B C(17)-methyltransferase n=1 Tax=Pseudonocardia sp. TRM90224 TaxID=2812678 RepID=UPI001E2C753F|nr:precorrin-3B C(17)-methyltransferase [Pseudonocardia sp. TRM90224]